MLDYEVFTEEQVSNLIPDGIYEFEVMEFHDTDQHNNPLMTKGNPEKGTKPERMIMIKLKIWDHNGSERRITDWIILNSQWAYKFRHFCDAIGELARYESKQFEGRLSIGKMGKLKLYRAKSKDPKYQDSNKIGDYIRLSDQKPPTKAQLEREEANKPFFSDDVPF